MVDGLILGAATFISFALTFWKLPGVIKRFILRHKLIADVVAAVISYVALSAVSKSIVAVVAAIMTSVFVGVALEIFDSTSTKELEAT